MSLTINSNLTAQSAISALRNSDNQLTTVSNQLASGNEIINPSINASGLAIGTSLQTAASTLQTALTGANNAQSLLQLAAGGLSNVGQILQRMQSLATQANGASSSTQGFLNEEYQALLQQINQISTGTTYSSTNLLNGSLAGSVALNTNQNASSGAVGAAATVYTISSVIPTDGQTITLGGQTITFTTNANNVNEAFFVAASNVTTIASSLAQFLNSSTNSTLDQFQYSSTAGALTVNSRGGLNTATTAQTLTSAAGTYITGTAATATVAASTSAGLAAGRTFATGAVNDANFANTNATLGGVSASLITNNAAFVGNVTTNNPVTATYDASTTKTTFTLAVGGFTYTATSGANGAFVAGTPLTFTSNVNSAGASGGSFTLQQTGTIAIGTNETGTAYAQRYANEVNNALSGVTFLQDQTISSYTAGGSITTGGVTTGSLAGTQFNFTSNTFNGANVSNVTVSAPTGSASNPTISLVVNGQTFTSSSSLGTSVGVGAQVVLTNQSNPLQSITFQNGATALNLSTAANAASAQAALQAAFGLNNGGTGLVFQVGAASSQTINVTLAGTGTTALGLTGTDISNQADALTAAAAVSNAITANSAQQALVGAQESRFNYVISNLTTSIQNTQAASGNYLQTDVSQASTTYASDQVEELAAISVLAQANQLPQNLLKLLA